MNATSGARRMRPLLTIHPPISVDLVAALAGVVQKHHPDAMVSGGDLGELVVMIQEEDAPWPR